MRAVLYSGPRTFSVEDQPDRPLEEGEVRLSVLRVGVCGSDKHVHEGHFGARYPLTPGHEIVGEVIEVTANSSMLVGDRVVVEDGVYCGKCDACKGGRFVYCVNIRALGVSLPGGAAERLVVPATKCYSIGALDLETAVLAEPLACVIHAMDRLAIHPGANVLVLGPGTAGQLLAVMARRNGASHVTIAGSSPSKLAIAEELGVDRAIAVDRSPGEARQALLEVQPRGFDVVIDATGVVSVLETAMELASIGGTVMVYGMAGAADRLSISPYTVFKRELTIMGSYAQALNLGRSIEYLQHLRVPVRRLVTHRFGLEDYGLALEALGSGDCIKAVLLPNGAAPRD